MPRDVSGGWFIAGLFGGVLAGVVAGLLLAPKTGKEAREIVGETGGQYISNLRDRVRRRQTEELALESIDGREES